MRIVTDYSSRQWDVLLSELGGHPLQSALWGDAKREVYGIKDERLAFYIKDHLVALVRIEQRGLKPFLKLAWIPQSQTLDESILNQLKKMGYQLCISSPWESTSDLNSVCTRKTIWIDLQKDKKKLWSALGYGVRKAHQIEAKLLMGSTTEETRDFYRLCISISRKKEFSFQYNEVFLQYLLNHSNKHSVETKLFLVKLSNKIVAGAFILRVGKNIHYMFGAVDRAYSKYRLGEFIQWSVIEWACENGCVLYDLEGIDEVNNPGVAAFKKKMGGEIIQLENLQINHLSWKGKILSKLVGKNIRAFIAT